MRRRDIAPADCVSLAWLHGDQAELPKTSSSILNTTRERVAAVLCAAEGGDKFSKALLHPLQNTSTHRETAEFNDSAHPPILVRTEGTADGVLTL